jgi:hypothetical protein
MWLQMWLQMWLHTCEYLSMNISALGTLESPRWISVEPTQPPSAAKPCCALCNNWCIAREVRGATCTLWTPCPVSRCSYLRGKCPPS